MDIITIDTIDVKNTKNTYKKYSTTLNEGIWILKMNKSNKIPNDAASD